MFRFPSLFLQCLYPVLLVWCPHILWRFALWYIHFLLLWCDPHHTHTDSCTKQKHSITHHALKHYSDYSTHDSCIHLTAAHSPAIGNPFMYAGKSNENLTGYFSGFFGANRFGTALSFATCTSIYHTQYMSPTHTADLLYLQLHIATCTSIYHTQYMSPTHTADLLYLQLHKVQSWFLSTCTVSFDSHIIFSSRFKEQWNSH